ncbi:[FeFe] hydrogenase H-cluster radical SAM maturase HydG [Paenibacillus sp. FSL R7-0331]|uniref:[FeFe] hydrogenase H-cluster radical SAM maturase HydG n=1 Tax=Paenibacillus sp. FSL R7-0331 TaxID=1536773 RepID=UPI0004F6A113|nr:[FeFe] hydrogenase H-cluster radical SAM maturase HydG [Paenibacillus sp. FSL R7-0331]AIQ52735.1 thiamine biosynthesis protein ThiH [Paenibacillus sp. FSL R7-0331]
MAHLRKDWEPADFIDDAEITASLQEAGRTAGNRSVVQSILDKARACKGLSHREAAVLLEVRDEDILQDIYKSAKVIKEKIYGNRIVLFAPLYISNYCVNNCEYCGYKHSNQDFVRRKLNRDELAGEVRVLQELGHKRLVIEAGEDPVHCDIDYVTDSIKTVYSVKVNNGSIRRVNINIAATTVEDYQKLRDAEIGTYILFQETYHRPTYAALHKNGPKHDYDWHTTAMDRAQLGGIDDVGVGVLYGLYDYKYDTVAMLMHAEHLEERFGVGPHTVSVPRLREAANVSLEMYPYLVKDEEFKQLVAVLRLAVPYAGMILSTREEPAFRDEVIQLGISQVSAGSSTGVGGYMEAKQGTAGASKEKPQFEVGDHRSPEEIIRGLCRDGYVPSYCTACYREGRTGDRFMRLAKSGQIHNVCQPNSLLTFKEYLLDYADAETQALGEEIIRKGLDDIPKEAARKITRERLQRLENGERDLRF